MPGNRESMRLVSDLLQKSQTRVAAVVSQGLGLLWQVKDLFSLGQGHQWSLFHTQLGERFEGRVELPASAIDENPDPLDGTDRAAAEVRGADPTALVWLPAS